MFKLRYIIFIILFTLFIYKRTFDKPMVKYTDKLNDDLFENLLNDEY